MGEKNRLARGVAKGVEQNSVIGSARGRGGEKDRGQNGEKQFGSHKARR
jgi:hypothetical protein